MKEEQLSLPNLLHLVKEHEQQIRQIKSDELWLQLDEGPCYVSIWPIIGGGRQLGYLAVFSDRKYWDDVLRLTVNNALNVYAIEFIKQKLVMDTREQVKESFMNQLFSEKKSRIRRKSYSIPPLSTGTSMILIGWRICQ